MSKKKQHIPLKPELPFDVDKNYFEDFENNILAKVSGKVFHLPLGISHPFKTPKGYFDKLEVSILEQTQKAKATRPFTSFWVNNSSFIRIAATLLTVCLFGWGFYQNYISTPQKNLTLSELQSEVIFAYLEEENLDFEDFNASGLEEGNPLLPNSFTISDDTEIKEFSEEELLQIIDFQFTNDI